MEEGGEAASQLCGGAHVHVGETSRGGGTIGAHQSPYLLDKIEQTLTLLPGQSLAEQHAEAADIGSKVGVEPDGLDEIAIRGHAKIPSARDGAVRARRWYRLSETFEVW